MWAVFPAGFIMGFSHQPQPKGNTMKDEFIYTPQPQPPNVLAELHQMHKATLQRLDMLVDLGHLILQELKNQSKVSD